MRNFVYRSILLISLLQFSSLQAEQVSTKTPLTKGFNHVGLSVLSLDKSTQFFTDTLGWTLKGQDKNYPASFLSDGEMFLTLWQVKDRKSAVQFNRKNNVGLHHLAFSVDSFETLELIYQKVKKIEGVIIEFAPELAYGGPTKHMMIREPSGNRLEFAHNPPKKENK